MMQNMLELTATENNKSSYEKSRFEMIDLITFDEI